MTYVTRFVLAGCALACAASAVAQYKYVDADGRVTYSDRPPPASAKILSEKKRADVAPAATLPFELQQAADRYPVMLYAGTRCAPCDDARNYLRSRGVPFTEKSVTTEQDIVAFRQQSPDGTAPVVSVGSRKVVGFSQPGLAALLDNAGYPATSVLPRDYQAPPPTALAPTARATAADPATAAPQAPRPIPAQPAPVSPSTPPGFRF